MKPCAVVILFYPNITTINRLLDALFKQNVHCILVDNSSKAQLSEKTLPAGQYTYICNQKNLGIAEAQNIGLVEASNLGFGFSFVFDQDSQITDTFIEKMCNEWICAQKVDDKLAAIGPQIYCHFTDKLEKPLIQKTISTLAPNVHEVNQIIASGMLLDLQCFQVIGLKDQSLFIDGVDHEWCWRARTLGYIIALTQNVVMRHSLGEKKINLGVFAVKIGTPVRLYYQTRNLLILSRRSYVPMYWKLRNLLYLPLKVLINTLLVDQRMLRLKYIIKGFWHGCIGRAGSLDR